MKNKQFDKYLSIRRFLYGKDAIKKGINRELLVQAAYKERIKWDWSKQTLDDAAAYLKYQHKLDPFYTTDREAFFN